MTKPCALWVATFMKDECAVGKSEEVHSVAVLSPGSAPGASAHPGGFFEVKRDNRSPQNSPHRPMKRPSWE